MKVIVLRKRPLTVIGCILAAVIMFGVVNVPAYVGAAATARQLPIYSVQTEEKKLSISFDAAWGADDTDTLISILGKHNVKATFFVVGDWVETYPEEVKKLHDAGHEVMNHSDTHPYFTKLSTEGMIAEIEKCNDKIEAVTGVRPTLLRFPYGDYNDNAVNAVRSLGMEPIQWSVDSLDWKDTSTAQSILERVTSQAHPGAIILCHNDAEYTPDALEGVLSKLIGEGYTFVPISALLVDGEYTMDHTGMQCPA